MFLKKSSDGNYYLNKSKGVLGKIAVKGSNIFIVRTHSTGSGGQIKTNSNIYVPEELLGKRIRFKVEVI